MIDLKIELLQKKKARAVYRWLTWLPVISVPWFMIMRVFMYRPSFAERVWAAGLPALPYIVILSLISWETGYVFVKRHARQGFVLVGLRFFTAFLSTGIGASGEDGIGFFLFVNGLLWWFGRTTGVRQVDEGVGMFVQQGERLSPLAITEIEPGIREMEVPSAAPGAAGNDVTALVRGEELLKAGYHSEAQEAFQEASRSSDARIVSMAASRLESFDVRHEPQAQPAQKTARPVRKAEPAATLADAEQLLADGQVDQAAAAFAAAFRSGDMHTRRAAIGQLEKLGRVQDF